MSNTHNPQGLDPKEHLPKYRFLSKAEFEEMVKVGESSKHRGNRNDRTYRTLKPEGYFLPKKKTDKENPAQKSLEHWQEIEFPDEFRDFKDYFYENCQGEDCALCLFYENTCNLCPIAKFDERCNFGIWNNIYNSKTIDEANMHKANMIALLYKIVLDEEEE